MSTAGRHRKRRSSPATTRVSGTVFVALIGDVVRSRRLTGSARRSVQHRLSALLERLNARHREAIAAKFLITIGDEFQCLLSDATVLPELIRELDFGMPDIELRLGIGRGPLHTDLKEFAIGMDGPVWHAARASIDDAKKHRRLGGVFSGFGTETDVILNAFARVLHYVRSRLTPRQRELLGALLEDTTQADVAEQAGISKQAVSKQARAAGVDAYREAEHAWRAALTPRGSTAL